MQLDLSFMETEWFQMLMDFSLTLLQAVFIIIAGRYLNKFVQRSMDKVLVGTFDHAVVNFAKRLVSVVILGFTFIVALTQLGVQTTSIVAALGAAGLAVGLALQGSLSNFASGILLILFKPCKSGDYINAAGVEGTVEHIDLLATKLMTIDNKLLVIPNASLMSGVITNYSAMETRRVDMVFGVSYDADIEQCKMIFQAMIDECEYVLKDPEPMIVLGELGASSINFYVRPWVKTDDYWDCYFELNESIKTALDKAEISIPFPQMDVHFDMPESNVSPLFKDSQDKGSQVG